MSLIVWICDCGENLLENPPTVISLETESSNTEFIEVCPSCGDVCAIGWSAAPTKDN